MSATSGPGVRPYLIGGAWKQPHEEKDEESAMRRFLVAAALMVAVLTPALASAQVVATVDIDTHDSASDGWAGPYSSPSLDSGRYRITIAGTASYWAVKQWGAFAGDNAANVCAGTAEPSPMTASSAVVYGPVGVDPEYIFAYPKGSPALCPGGAPDRPAPLHGSSLQISTDGGATFRHIEPVDRAYNPAHSYQYDVELAAPGTVQFRFVDRPTNDNYGIFTATIERIP
jgi:hypothetical protein